MHKRASHILASLAAVVAVLTLTAIPANAAKTVVGALGKHGSGLGAEFEDPLGVAVNNSTGDIYVAARFENRVQRFDASHAFVSAWGFDTIQAGKPGDLGKAFEICIIAADCKRGLTIGELLSPAFGGQFSGSEGIAVDQASGNVYVTNAGFLRVEVFSAGGNFIRAFGRDVIQPGKPGDIGEDTFEVCTVAADCKTGKSGDEGGSFKAPFTDNSLTIIPEGAPHEGNVLVTDRSNRRVQEFTATGSFVRAFGWDVVESGPGDTAADEFEVCKGGVDACQEADAGAGVGQFGAATPRGVAVGSTGALYTVELSSNFRVQKFKIAGDEIIPEGPFAPGILDGADETDSPTGITVDGADDVLVTKGFPEEATPTCLNTISPSSDEKRLLRLSSLGSLLDTSLACAGVTSAIGLALNQSSGRAYLSSTFPTGTAQVYVLDEVSPPTSTIDPVTQFDAFSATFEGEIDPQGSPTECRFDYLTKVAFEQNLGNGKDGFAGAAKVSCESSPISGTDPVSVSAVTTSVAPNTTYVIRLVALKSPKPLFGEVATASASEEFTTAEEPPPTVITGAASPRGATTARLGGLVNPNNSPTEAHFEYGTAGPCSAHPCASTALQSVGTDYIPPGFAYTSVLAQLEGLTPGTDYHYRLVATNGKGTNAGADRTFVTRTIEELEGPDRGIELVNAPDKGNQNVFSLVEDTSTPVLHPNGESALWWVTSGAPGGTASAGNTFLAERKPDLSPSGWVSRNLIPPAEEQFGNASLPYLAEKATPDLETFIFNVGASSVFQDEGKALVRLDREQSQEVLATYESGVHASKGEITDDGAHVLVINPDTEELEDVGQDPHEIVSRMPGGAPSQCGLDTTGQSFAGWSGVQVGAGVHWNAGYRMIDVEEASRVYFETRPDGNCSGLYGLYVRDREDIDDPDDGATTLIDPGTGGQHVEFIRSTPDGEAAYFATTSNLDPADQNSGADVYRWDEGSEESSCLTCVVPNANVDDLGGQLQQIMVSDDFSRVYFQSREQLVPGHGKAGELNTYALVDDEEIHFVAGPGVGVLGTGVAGADAMLSRNGEVLVFKSALNGGAGSLTTDDLAPQCVTRAGMGPCQELFLYDDRDGSLECVSCSKGGETTFSVGSTATTTGSDFRISADGETIAFITRQALVPSDVNQGPDVYEWRDGAARLLSDGETLFQREFAAPQVRGVDADGTDVLFSLASPGWTGFELDGLASLYDAREGSPKPVPPSPPPRCEGDSCQGPLQGAPPLDRPASSGFKGRGNVVAPVKAKRPCAKKRGRAKRRCVRKQRRRAAAARRRGER